MTPIPIRAVALFVVASAVVSLAGCGDNRPATAVVRGTVTFGGKAVPNGTVNYFPESGPTATGELRPDGTYELTTFQPGDGAVPGKYTVVIVAMEDMTNRLPEDRNPLPPPIVPVKYTSIATSDLRAEVKATGNTIDFDLKEEKKP